jgi:hypothetical protein
MINFYKLYNKTGLDKEEYSLLLEQLLDEEYTKELELIKHIIKIMPEHAYQYAYKIIGTRWLEAEPYIMEDSYFALMYAQYVIRGRWKELESSIITNPRLVWQYALYILQSRWIEAEPCIMKVPIYASYYSAVIMRERWIEAEPYIKLEEYTWRQYCQEFGI